MTTAGKAGGLEGRVGQPSHYHFRVLTFLPGRNDKWVLSYFVRHCHLLWATVVTAHGPGANFLSRSFEFFYKTTLKAFIKT